MAWEVGDRVRNKPEMAHLYEGTHWAEKLAKPRMGTVREVPLAIRTTGQGRGTILIEWDSLTDMRGPDHLWVRWMHSDHIEKANPNET